MIIVGQQPGRGYGVLPEQSLAQQRLQHRAGGAREKAVEISGSSASIIAGWSSGSRGLARGWASGSQSSAPIAGEKPNPSRPSRLTL